MKSNESAQKERKTKYKYKNNNAKFLLDLNILTWSYSKSQLPSNSSRPVTSWHNIR